MTEELLYRLIAGFGAGLALLLAGSISILLAKRSHRVRIVLSAAAAIACGLLTVTLIPIPMALASVSATVLGIAFLSGLTSNRLAAATGKCLGVARRPTCQAVTLMVIGAAAMAGTLGHLTRVEEAVVDADMKWMVESSVHPDLQVVTSEIATTDLGRTITLRETANHRDPAELEGFERQLFPDMRRAQRIFRVAPPSDVSNCHGWIFTGGEYWVSPEDVETILTDNGYQAVSEPRPGDLVVYRLANSIAHTAILHSVLPSRPMMVEGKWGWMGVYLHAIDESSYGKSYTFYRSSRPGHLLAGLDGRPTVATSRPGPKPATALASN